MGKSGSGKDWSLLIKIVDEEQETHDILCTGSQVTKIEMPSSTCDLLSRHCRGERLAADCGYCFCGKQVGRTRTQTKAIESSRASGTLEEKSSHNMKAVRVWWWNVVDRILAPDRMSVCVLGADFHLGWSRCWWKRLVGSPGTLRRNLDVCDTKYRFHRWNHYVGPCREDSKSNERPTVRTWALHRQDHLRVNMQRHCMENKRKHRKMWIWLTDSCGIMLVDCRALIGLCWSLEQKSNGTESTLTNPTDDGINL